MTRDLDDYGYVQDDEGMIVDLENEPTGIHIFERSFCYIASFITKRDLLLLNERFDVLGILPVVANDGRVLIKVLILDRYKAITD